MKRHSKENKILQWLEEIKLYSEPIHLNECECICNPKLYAETQKARIEAKVTDKIYKNTLEEVSRIKILIDSKQRL